MARGDGVRLSHAVGRRAQEYVDEVVDETVDFSSNDGGTCTLYERLKISNDRILSSNYETQLNAMVK
jgi:hypothetical protein